MNVNVRYAVLYPPSRDRVQTIEHTKTKLIKRTNFRELALNYNNENAYNSKWISIRFDILIRITFHVNKNYRIIYDKIVRKKLLRSIRSSRDHVYYTYKIKRDDFFKIDLLILHLYYTNNHVSILINYYLFSIYYNIQMEMNKHYYVITFGNAVYPISFVSLLYAIIITFDVS